MIKREKGKIEVKPYVFKSLVITGIALVISLALYYMFLHETISKGWKIMFSVGMSILIYWIFQMSSKAYRRRFIVANEPISNSFIEFMNSNCSYLKSLDKDSQNDFLKEVLIRVQELKFIDEGKVLSEDDKKLFVAAGLICFDKFDFECFFPVNKVQIILNDVSENGKSWVISQSNLHHNKELEKLEAKLKKHDKAQNRALLLVSKNKYVLQWIQQIQHTLGQEGRDITDFATELFAGKFNEEALQTQFENQFALTYKTVWK